MGIGTSSLDQEQSASSVALPLQGDLKSLLSLDETIWFPWNDCSCMEVSSLYGLSSRFCCFWNPRRRYTSVNDRQAQMLWGVWTSTPESPQEDTLVTLCTFSFEEKSDGWELTVFLFVCFSFWPRVSGNPGWPWTWCVVKYDLGFLILLLLPPQCWDFRHIPSCSIYTVPWLKTKAPGMLGKH